MMAGWLDFAAAFVLFLASHAVPARPALAARLAATLGRRGYLVAFNALSLVLLAWVIGAAGQAPYVPLWDQLEWQRWAVNLAMPVAILLTVFGVATANPFSFGGRAQGFAPARPGICGVTRQPLIWALLLWATAHLLANGDLAHAILFGGFALMAALGLALRDRRARRQLGEAEWSRLTARTALVPGWALLSGRWRPCRGPAPGRLALAVIVWLALLHLHPLVIGVSPLP